MAAAGNARQYCSERSWIGVDRFHQANGIGVGCGLPIALVARLQNGLGGNDDRSAPYKVSEQHSEQERHFAMLEHGARAIAMCNVAELVSDHARHLVGALGLVDQALEDVDDSPWQGDRIGFIAAYHGDAQRNGLCRSLFESGKHLVECSASGTFCRIGSTSKSRPRTVLVQDVADLRIDGSAELDLSRIGNKGGEAGCNFRYAIDCD